MIPRFFRYSLRTLLLGSLFAGGCMMVWRVWDGCPMQVWDAPKVPVLSVPLPRSVALSAPPSQYRLEFSPSGRYLCVQPHNQRISSIVGRYYNDDLDRQLGECEFHILDPMHSEERRIVARGWGVEWYGERDEFLRRSGCKQVYIDHVDHGDPFLEFEIAHDDMLMLSPSGKYLVRYHRAENDNRAVVEERLVYRNVKDWKVTADFDLAGKVCAWDRDDRDERVLMVIKKNAFLKEPYADFFINVCAIENGRQLWCKQLPGTLTAVSALFAGRKVLVWVSSNIVKSRLGMIECDTLFEFNAKDGELVGTKFYENGEWVDSNSTAARRVAFLLPQRKAAWQVERSSEKYAVSETDNSARAWCVEIPKNHRQTIGRPVVNENGRMVAAMLDNERLGVWVRNREHVEWWGIYERREFWAAAVLFLIFAWSVVRDFRTRQQK